MARRWAEEKRWVDGCKGEAGWWVVRVEKGVGGAFGVDLGKSRSAYLDASPSSFQWYAIFPFPSFLFSFLSFLSVSALLDAESSRK